MNATLTTLSALLAAIPQADRDTLRKAYASAGDMFTAMASVMEAEDELAETISAITGDDHDRPYWQQQRKEQIGAAAVAMERVPIKWLAVIGITP